ncbi:hypothetical protein [Wenxinia saemankumensis]|uniref:Uncharacterized protein n=1 Tax=Wenxinia saemankumensis TaxID=1447782 RepID=A0A1M6AUA3_9RHOB|nr:hypothetical protein [Wenxinia saemankumensis]SHI39803.1 hypothetical protein SAMN05444417_0616 [Wenxinia saemankumensis]
MVDYVSNRASRGSAGGGIALFVVAGIASMVVGLAVLDGLSGWPEDDSVTVAE